MKFWFHIYCCKINHLWTKSKLFYYLWKDNTQKEIWGITPSVDMEHYGLYKNENIAFPTICGDYVFEKKWRYYYSKREIMHQSN
jgi:hypothetical protein